MSFRIILASDVTKATLQGRLSRNTSTHRSPFSVTHSNDLYQVFLHSVWIQDVLDRAKRVSHRPREVRKMASKGTH